MEKEYGLNIEFVFGWLVSLLLFGISPEYNESLRNPPPKRIIGSSKTNVWFFMCG